METARVFDLDTGRIYTIPACELAPGMITAKMQGMEEPVWVEAAKMPKPPIKHRPFTGERKMKVEKIQSLLKEAYFMTCEQWEEGFRRDTDPDQQLDEWIKIGSVYRDAVGALGIVDDLERQEALRLLAICSSAPREQVHILLDVQLPQDKIDWMIDRYYGISE